MIAPKIAWFSHLTQKRILKTISTNTMFKINLSFFIKYDFNAKTDNNDHR